MGQKMRAVVLRETGGPGVLCVEELPIPVPADHEVLVKVLACGICGHDQADRLGLARKTLPAVLGHEISGIVVDVGRQVSRFKAGDRVAAKQYSTCGYCSACRSGADLSCPDRRFNYGGYAEYASLHESSLLTVPPEVDLKGACVIACTTGTTLQALRQIAHLSAGESVLVTGAGGGLGIQGMQVAKALGCQTIAVTSSETKVAALRAYGADQVVLTRDRDFWRQILEATDGRGVDVVLDNVGAPSLFGPSFRALAQRGRYVFTGQVARAKVEVYPAFIFAKEAVITGSVSTLMSTFVDSMELVRAGQVQTVVQEFALDDIVGAHEVMDGRGFLGRGILVP